MAHCPCSHDLSQVLEGLWCSFVLLIGAMIYAFLFGQISLLIRNRHSGQARLHEKMEIINESMRNLNLPLEVQERVRNYYDFKFACNKLLDTESFLCDLSPALRSEVSLCINMYIVQSVPLFKNLDEDFLMALIIHFRSQVFLPGDYIVKTGDVGYEMFFITRGALAVWDEMHDVEIASLSAGSYFGEMAVISGGRRQATVIATSYCDLNVLNREDFEVYVDSFLPSFVSRPVTDAPHKCVIGERQNIGRLPGCCRDD